MVDPPGEQLIHLKKELDLPTPVLQKISVAFREEMARGLARKTSSLKMLSSHLGKPAGDEKGSFIALDFGGTNVRVMLVELLGQGKYLADKRIAFPLKDDLKRYDYTTSTVESEELFRFISRKIKLLAGEEKIYQLGHTFSYPCRSEGVNSAILLKWTKEIKTAGAEGQDIGKILQRALEQENIKNIIPTAIISDTVGTLLTGGYREKDCDIGTILGTGHNTCYLEPNPPGSKQPLIINIEAGNFDKLPLSKYDQMLDKEAEKPGEQLLEKMVSGKYLGELVRLVLLDLYAQSGFFRNHDLYQTLKKGIFTAADMSVVLCENTGEKIAEQSLEAVVTVCRLIRKRSASLAAATYAGILLHLDPALQNRHVIAVDGSLYEKMPGYAGELRTALKNILGYKYDQVEFLLTKDGSGIGAAIAAAMTGRTIKN